MALTAGETLQLTVSDIAFGGEGVARVDGFVIFVPFVAPGEVVEAEVTEVKKRFGRARLLRVLKPSGDRVNAPCRYFGECGGCQYQHLAYPAQLELKHKQVRDLLCRLGGLEPAVIAPIIGCPQPFGYRNRIMVRTQWDKFKQGLNFGFIRTDNRLVLDIEECTIAEPTINRQLKQVRQHPPPKGGLKVVLRVPPEGWEVPPDSFFQNNYFLLPRLVEVVRGCFQSSGCRSLADVYCGVGFFSLELADLTERFVGVEYDRLAVNAARKNAQTRLRSNGEFIAGKAEALLAEVLAGLNPGPTAVLLDPPRKGCAPNLLQLLRRSRPEQIIYVSCDPATMARDLNVLCAEAVFMVAQVVPLDMFPQTAHVECVADVRSAKQPPPHEAAGLN